MTKKMSATQKTKAQAKRMIRKISPWLVRLGRAGYAGKGLVYVMMGSLATHAAIVNSGESTGPRDALRTIGEAPFGRLILILVAVGLFGYAAWRLISAVTDAERRGDDPTGAGIRMAAVFRGLAYGSLGVWTLRYVMFSISDEGNGSQSVADRVLDFPGGAWIVVAAGLAFIGYALYQVYRALSGKFLNRLALNDNPKTEVWVRHTGRFGIIARAVVFGMIGVLLVKGGWTRDPSNVGGINESLDAIARQPTGDFLFGLVAMGLIAFGLFEIATARFRIMRAM